MLEGLARIDLQVIVVAPPDAERRAAETTARNAAIAAGRGDLFDEAISAARDATLRLFSRERVQRHLGAHGDGDVGRPR